MSVKSHPMFKRASDESAVGTDFNFAAESYEAQYRQVMARDPKPAPIIARAALMEMHRGIIAAGKRVGIPTECNIVALRELEAEAQS